MSNLTDLDTLKTKISKAGSGTGMVGLLVRALEKIMDIFASGDSAGVTIAHNAEAPVKTGNVIGTDPEYLWRFTYAAAAQGVAKTVSTPIGSGFDISFVTELFIIDNTIGVLPMTSPVEVSNVNQTVNITVNKATGVISITPGASLTLGGGNGYIKFTKVAA